MRAHWRDEILEKQAERERKMGHMRSLVRAAELGVGALCGLRARSCRR